MGIIVSPQLAVQVNALDFTGGSTITMSLPPGLLDGDDVWLCVGVGGSTAAGITAASAGWTRLGSETDTAGAGTTNAARFASIWRKTWHTGDPTTCVFTTASTSGVHVGFICRGGAGITPTTDASHGPSTNTSPLMGNFAPAVSARDLRLYVLWHNCSSAQFVSVFPSVTPSDTNPAGVKVVQLASTRVNNPGATSGAVEVWYSYTDTGADSGTSTLTLNNSDLWFSRSLDLSDGVDPSLGVEVAPGTVLSGITADAMLGSVSDGLEAAKGKFVGGAHIL